MTGRSRTITALAAALTSAVLLAACVVGPKPAAEGAAAAVNPITQGEIAVTALPPSNAVAAPSGTTPSVPPAAAAVAAAPVVPVVPKSPAQRDCEARKGHWSNAAKGLRSCVFITKDSGKRCTAASQCDSQCLSRSGTCAPYKPLFGCNEIFDDYGRSVTQCLE